MHIFVIVVFCDGFTLFNAQCLRANLSLGSEILSEMIMPFNKITFLRHPRSNDIRLNYNSLTYSLQDDIIAFTDCHFLSIQTVTGPPEVSGAPALTASEVHDTGRPRNRMKCGTLSGGEAQ